MRRQVLITRQAISPRFAIRTLENIPLILVQRGATSCTPISHPEHAERGGLDRRVERGRDAEREHAAGIDRIDHAVVPEPGGGVIRMPLRFVLLADGGLELLFRLGWPILSLRLQTIAPHGR